MISQQGNPMRGKLTTPELALAELKDHDLIAVGGVLHENKPIALERALMRMGFKSLKYIALSGSGFDLDLLVAVDNLIAEIFVPVVTFDDLGFAPCYRRAVEEGRVKAHIVDVASIMAGYFAAASGVPFHPVTAVQGSDVTKYNPLLAQIRGENNEPIYISRSIEPDLALIHVQESDIHGNARLYGSTAKADHMLARAAKRVVISCDRIVPTEKFERDPMATTIPSMYVDSVCHLPLGAHPTGSPAQYLPDMDYIKTYWTMAEKARKSKDLKDMNAFLEKSVFQCATHQDYLDQLHGSTIVKLCMGGE
jgi:glutaconate CoA-transferase subunit A